MSKLVAHKVKVRLSAQTLHNQANHLVQGNASIHFQRVAIPSHSRIDFLIEKPLGNRLVTNDCLVM